VKFGRKIPNRLGKMPQNLTGDFLTHTVQGSNFRFPIDISGHRFNRAAATAQPVIHFYRATLRVARLSHRRPSVRPSVCLSVCHTRGLCPHGSTYTITISSPW